MFYDSDADLSLIRAKKVAVIGYGSQGHAHALNLKDSGVDVRVGLPATSRSRGKAAAAGLLWTRCRRVTKWADVVMILVPDHIAGGLYNREIAPNLSAGKMLMLAHGFNIRFGTIKPAKDIDVTMIAPKSPGHRVRELYVEGAARRRWSPSTRTRRATRGRWRCPTARRLASPAPGVIETTFAEETETDLFGEQTVLCGGVSALVKAGFETLVEAGYQPEIAYFECLHELKLIVDLMYRGGLNYMRYSVSDTAEYGDYSAGPRIVTDRDAGDDEADPEGYPGRQLREGVDRRERTGPAALRGHAREGADAGARAGRRQAARDDAVPRSGDGPAGRRQRVRVAGSRVRNRQNADSTGAVSIY